MIGRNHIMERGKVMDSYPRHLIFGTLEHARFEQDGWQWGWFSTPSFLERVRCRVCRHDFTLWCTNKGVTDVIPMKIRICKKCGKQEEKHSWS